MSATLLVIADTIVIDAALQANIQTFSGLMEGAQSVAWAILMGLAVIELALLGIASLFKPDPGGIIHALFKKCLHISVFIFLVGSFPFVAELIKDTIIGGLGGADMARVSPAEITESGFQKVRFLFDGGYLPETDEDGFAKKRSFAEGLASPLETMTEGTKELGKTLVTGLLLVSLAMLIIITHTWIACQVYLCTVEYYLIAAVAVLFVPLGINEHTKGYADRAFGALVSQSVKLAVMIALVAASGPLLDAAAPSDLLSIYQLSVLFCVCFTFALVITKAPATAAALFGGGGGLGATDAVGMLSSAVSAGVAGAQLGGEYLAMRKAESGGGGGGGAAGLQAGASAVGGALAGPVGSVAAGASTGMASSALSSSSGPSSGSGAGGAGASSVSAGAGNANPNVGASSSQSPQSAGAGGASATSSPASAPSVHSAQSPRPHAANEGDSWGGQVFDSGQWRDAAVDEPHASSAGLPPDFQMRFDGESFRMPSEREASEPVQSNPISGDRHGDKTYGGRALGWQPSGNQNNKSQEW